jgi:antitoxin component of MazEF toxin-antitoxin module
MTLCSLSAEPIGDPQFAQDLLVLGTFPAPLPLKFQSATAPRRQRAYVSVRCVRSYVQPRSGWERDAMKVIRKLARNGNAITVSIHPAVMKFCQWRPGDHVVMEVLSTDEVRLRRPQVRDMGAPIETSVIEGTLPVEGKA